MAPSSLNDDSPTTFSSVSKRLESPSAERNKEPIWGILSSQIFPRLRRANHPNGKSVNDSVNDNQQKNQQNDRDHAREPWKILEIAAGAGVHTEYFASRLLSLSEDNDDDNAPRPPPPFWWHPTDAAVDARESIRSRILEANLGNVVAPPKALTLGASDICLSSLLASSASASTDASGTDTVDEETTDLDLILCINMIHISPWEATLGLMKLAGKHLTSQHGNEGNDAASSGAGDGSAAGYLYCYGPYRQDGKIVPSNENFDRSLKSRNSEWGVRNLKDVIDAANREGLELVDCVDMPSNNTSLIFRRRRPPPPQTTTTTSTSTTTTKK